MLETKKVKFNGKELIAIMENEKIYVSVKNICNNLGMSKNLSDTQIKKINNDELLKGASKLTHLETNGGLQQVLVLELDYLPIWLAKMNPNYKDLISSNLRRLFFLSNYLKNFLTS